MAATCTLADCVAASVDMRCSRCLAPYCSSDHQKQDWRTHKLICRTALSDEDLVSNRRTLLLVDLTEDFWEEEFYDWFRAALRHAFERVIEIRDKKELERHLDGPPPGAILFTEGKFGRLCAKTRVPMLLKAYVEQLSGRAVFGCFFASTGYGHGILRTYFDLPWESGQQLRTTNHLQRSHHTIKAADYPMLAQSFSVKGCSMMNVRAADALYLPNDESVIENPRGLGVPTYIDTTHAQACMTHVGTGYVGFSGDPVACSETASIILAMLGAPRDLIPHHSATKVDVEALRRISSAASSYYEMRIKM